MPESVPRPEDHSTEIPLVANDVAVVIDLSRKHGKRLSEISARLDTHNRRLQHVEQRFDESVLRCGLRFDEIDDRFVQVEQRLDFMSSQLAELIKRPAG